MSGLSGRGLARALAASLAIFACSTIAEASLLDSGWLDLQTLPFIPIPEIAADPNSGTTYGLLPVFFFPDAKQEVRHILAPDLNHNPTLGTGGYFRSFNYPDDDSEWYVVAGFSQRIAREVDLDYATGLSRESWPSVEGRLYFERDPTTRFFGIGNESRFGDESNYTTEQLFTDLLFAINFSREARLTIEERPRFVRIHRGAFRDVPFTGDRFPALAGLGGGTELLNRALLSYDSRDSTNLPTRGGLLEAFAGFVDRRLGSSLSYVTFGVEGRRYVPLGDRVTLAGHFHLRYLTTGRPTPFWVLSRLGGEAGGDESALGLPLGTALTWRGGGTGRFVDRNLCALNVELRVRVFELGVAGAQIALELAPFIDAGRVFPRLDTNPLAIDDLHPAGGIGFRARVSPFVVGFVDVGYGGDGSAVFSGINYPF